MGQYIERNREADRDTLQAWDAVARGMDRGGT